MGKTEMDCHGLSWVTVRACRHGPFAFFQRDSGQRVRHVVFDAPIESILVDSIWETVDAGRCSYGGFFAPWCGEWCLWCLDIINVEPR